MLRNDIILTENSKTDYEDENKYKNNFFKNNPQNISIPYYQSNKSQLMLRKKDNTFNNRNAQNLSNSENNKFINSIPNNGLINFKNLPNGGYEYEKENKKKEKNNNKKKIYINNYNMRKKKCKIARNYENVAKYFSKDHKRTKITNDIILTDFDTINSKNNNIFYLINNCQESDNNINNINIYNNESKNNRNYYKNNIIEQKISKISLPFCVIIFLN